MSSQLQKLTGAWTTDILPTQTTLTHIDPTNINGIISTLLSASSAYPTVTKRVDLYNLARAVKGAKASLSVVSAQNYIATATDTQELPRMTQVIWNATMELQDLEMGFNLYQMKLSMSANTIFAVCFALLMALHTGLFVWKQYLYFGMCLVAGTALELAGYIARTSSISDYSNKVPFICQVISLTLAPAVIMAGIYYLLAQLLVVYGRQYSRLKPLWFSYIFIFCDMLSLIIQAAGGGLAAIKLQRLESTDTGTNIMVTGIAIQVVSMTLFVYLLFDFLFNIYFKASTEVRFSVFTLFDLLFQTERGKTIQSTFLHKKYNQQHRKIWSQATFGYYPLVILISVALIYIRCIYRLVELSEGWTGYLITHEEYVMTLDGLLVLLTCIMYIPFHPGFMMGAANAVSMREQSAQLPEEEGFSDSDSSMDMEKHVEMENSDFQTPGRIDPYYVPRIQSTVPSYASPKNPFEDFQEKMSQFPSPAVSAERPMSQENPFSDEPEKSNEAKKSKEPEKRSSFAFWKSKTKASPAIEENGLVAIPYTHTSQTGDQQSRDSQAGNDQTRHYQTRYYQAREDQTTESHAGDNSRESASFTAPFVKKGRKNRSSVQTDTSSMTSVNPYAKVPMASSELRASPYEQFTGPRQSTFSASFREQNVPVTGSSNHHNIHWEIYDKFKGDKPERDFTDVMSQFTTDEFFFSFGSKK